MHKAVYYSVLALLIISCGIIAVGVYQIFGLVPAVVFVLCLLCVLAIL